MTLSNCLATANDTELVSSTFIRCNSYKNTAFYMLLQKAVLPVNHIKLCLLLWLKFFKTISLLLSVRRDLARVEIH